MKSSRIQLTNVDTRDDDKRCSSGQAAAEMASAISEAHCGTFFEKKTVFKMTSVTVDIRKSADMRKFLECVLFQFKMYL